MTQGHLRRRADAGPACPVVGTGAMPDWMEPFARTISAAKKYVAAATES